MSKTVQTLYEIDQSSFPPSCLPYGLDQSNLIDITNVGAMWRSYLDPSTGKVHDGEKYWNAGLWPGEESDTMLKVFFIGFTITWVLTWGIMNAWSDFEKDNRNLMREAVGLYIIGATLVAIIWPVGLPFIICFSGFMKDGWKITPGI